LSGTILIWYQDLLSGISLSALPRSLKRVSLSLLKLPELYVVPKIFQHSWLIFTEVQPISIVYFTSRGVRLALGKGNGLGIGGTNGVW